MKEGLSQFNDIHLTAIGLFIFLFFFLGVIWWTSRKHSRILYQRVETLPFEKGESNE